MQRAEGRSLRLGTPDSHPTQPLASSPPGPPLGAADSSAACSSRRTGSATGPVAPEVRLPGVWKGGCQGAEPEGPPVPSHLAGRADPDRLPAAGSKDEVQTRLGVNRALRDRDRERVREPVRSRPVRINLGHVLLAGWQE